MLLQLNIKNFALIEELTMNFDEGFNIFSGETGAGKSILIDAINFVLGGKFNKDLIRTGENSTFVEAVFIMENPKTEEILRMYDIDIEEVLIITRETFNTGKSITKINGKAITISNLKIITDTLIDITGQHENQYLLHSSNHIFYLDSFCEELINPILKEYKVYYDKLQSVENKILELSGKDGEKDKLVDFLKYQIDEISSSKVYIGEEEELEEKFKILSNSEKISNALQESYEYLYNQKDDNLAILDALNIIVRELKSVESNFSKIKEVTEGIESCYYSLEEYTNVLRNLKDTVYYDEDELQQINSRIYFITTLKKKYGNSIKEILEYKDKITKDYEELINRNEILEELKKDKEKIVSDLNQIAERLHKCRENISKDLENKIKEELSYIGLEKSKFVIIVEKDKLSYNGYDKVQFVISTNPGEPLKPLEKIVSGGELSRIMLALKTVFVDKDKIPTVIFDEIDTGISGRVAQSVAEKMFLISKSHQVFCVTHLPQIACMSDIHYLVEKNVCDGKTYTKIKKLNLNEKQQEVARMIGGAELTELTLEHSTEMISLAKLKKCELEKKVV